MLSCAIEVEVDGFIAACAEVVDDRGALRLAHCWDFGGGIGYWSLGTSVERALAALRGAIAKLGGIERDVSPGCPKKALAALWPQLPTRRYTVHKHPNLLAHAPDRLHEEVSADYTGMIYGVGPGEITERFGGVCCRRRTQRGRAGVDE